MEGHTAVDQGPPVQFEQGAHAHKVLKVLYKVDRCLIRCSIMCSERWTGQEEVHLIGPKPSGQLLLTVLLHLDTYLLKLTALRLVSILKEISHHGIIDIFFLALGDSFSSKGQVDIDSQGDFSSSTWAGCCCCWLTAPSEPQ